MQAVPEYESCLQVATRADVSVRDVYIAALTDAAPKAKGSRSA